MKNNLKAILLAGAIGVATLFPNFASAENQCAEPTKVSQVIEETSLENELNDYVKYVLGNESEKSKRNLYFIFQRHSSEVLSGLSEDLIKLSKERSLISQMNVYRVLEYLHKNKSLGVFVNEGLFYNYKRDLNNPCLFYDISAKIGNNMTLLEKVVQEKDVGFNEDQLESIVKFAGYDGGNAAGLVFPDLYCMGFEEKEVHDVVLLQRGEDAVKHALQHSDELFEEGLIENKDSAIVIGEKHYLDYFQYLFGMPDQLKNLKFNPIMVFTKIE